MMKTNQWTLGLLATGLVSLASVASAEEKPVSQVLTALSATTLSGYIDTSAIWKFGTGNANMPGRVYDGADVQDGFNLNVVSLTLDKPLEEGQWSSGYHIQMLLGPGATKRGTGSLISGGGDIAFNEAYVAVRVPVGNGLDLHVGQFGTYNGYEAYDTYKNPNWSRSYGFYIESSAHTGVSASYKVNDSVSFMAGVGNIAGFNNQVDAKASIESKKAYLGMITLTAPDSWGTFKGGSLSVGYTSGDAIKSGGLGNVSGIAQPAGRWTQGNFYVGASIPLPVTGLSLGIAYDYTSGSAFKKSYANATALYLSYQATEKLKLNTRVDYASGSDGSFGYLSATPKAYNELGSFTFTADYALWKNVISRMEFRWDHVLSGGAQFGGTVPGVPRDKNALSLAANFIYVF
jgi:hypothetical protein